MARLSGRNAVSRSHSAWSLRHDCFFRNCRCNRPGCVPARLVARFERNVLYRCGPAQVCFDVLLPPFFSSHSLTLSMLTELRVTAAHASLRDERGGGAERNRWCRSVQPPANILNPYRDSRTGHVVKRDHPRVQHSEKHALDVFVSWAEQEQEQESRLWVCMRKSTEIPAEPVNTYEVLASLGSIRWLTASLIINSSLRP